MAAAPKPGDRVEWNTSQGPTRGIVKRKLTRPIRIKGHEVKASPDNPELLVESERTGAEAAHKPGALRRIRGSKRSPASDRSKGSS